MTGESFFTQRNSWDAGMDKAPAAAAEKMLDACVRRLAREEGALNTAVRVQRIADICAGAIVLPIEHWREQSKPEPLAPKSRFQAWLDRPVRKGNIFMWGLILGILIASQPAPVRIVMAECGKQSSEVSQ